jgi:hypothetical protein
VEARETKELQLAHVGLVQSSLTTMLGTSTRRCCAVVNIAKQW